jgi:hypothetical protein
MSNLPPDYIDESIQGDDRKLLEIFYEASLSGLHLLRTETEQVQGGSADEAILRGIKAVLAATAKDRLISAKLAGLTLLLLRNLPAIACVIAAAALAVNRIEGWSWFLFVGLLMTSYPTDSSSGS